MTAYVQCRSLVEFNVEIVSRTNLVHNAQSSPEEGVFSRSFLLLIRKFELHVVSETVEAL